MKTLTVSNALAQWSTSYKRAAILQGSFASLSSLVGFFVWWFQCDSSKRSTIWLLVSFLNAGIVLFTLAAIMPTNRRLLSIPDQEKDSKTTKYLLNLWNKLHFVRTAISLVSFGISIYLLT